MEQARRWVDDFVTATLIVKEKGDLRPPNGNVKKEVKP
jgi:hypothetical protein